MKYNTTMFDKVWINAKIAHFDEDNISIKENSFLAVKDKKIAKIGQMANFDKKMAGEIIELTINC